MNLLDKIFVNISILCRFWVGEHGERLANPFVLCLNLVGCRVERNQEVRPACCKFNSPSLSSSRRL